MKTKFLFILLSFSISLFACDSKKSVVTPQVSANGEPIQESPKPANVSTETAKKMIAENKSLVIIDVRTPGEVSQGIIPGAKVIDINNPDFEKLIAALDKAQPTLVYCKAGGRSKRACDIMNKQGFMQLYNLEEGYDSWK
jgi:rhodanese-related sulfurtransferase